MLLLTVVHQSILITLDGYLLVMMLIGSLELETLQLIGE
jgi:hypothetical protein